MPLLERKMERLPNRAAAGRLLAEKLRAYRNRNDVLVLALPRGGLPVAAEIAAALAVPLDIFLVRKLGVPGHEEFAMGAIASGDREVLDRDLVGRLKISDAAVDKIRQRERCELLRRERAYRGAMPLPELRQKTIVVVDDGVATGASMRAAIMALRDFAPARIVVAVPVLPVDVATLLRNEVDDLICLETPSPFYGVGYWYENFTQVSDEQVQSLLRVHRDRAHVASWSCL
jgi:putative phosphoribosyl transferase